MKFAVRAFRARTDVGVAEVRTSSLLFIAISTCSLISDAEMGRVAVESTDTPFTLIVMD
jgi:hypothetical protein